MKIKIIAGGTLKGSLFAPLYSTYEKRIHRWKIEMQEPCARQWVDLAPLKSESWILLDHRAPVMTSQEFAGLLDHVMGNYGVPTFLIGPACGLDDRIKKQACHKISFGSMTWPHLLVRILLIEQIYRAQQHIQGHPYSFI